MADRRDSTPKRDELEQALARAERRYRDLVERTAYGICRVTAEGQLLDANPALVRMLGYGEAAELLAVADLRALHLEPAELDRVFAASAASPGAWVETRWKKRDGSPVTVRVTMQPAAAPAGALELIAEDVTERQRHDQLMRRTERMAALGTTLAGVAHELNNPLAAIMGFAQLLLKKNWPEEDRAALETINHEAIRSAKIVKDLLALARTREVERRAPMNLNDIAGYILRTRRYALETYGIACELRLDAAIPPVRGDRMQLEQVVLNLVANAEQALRSVLDEPREVEGGAAEAPPARVVVSTRVESSSVVLEVEDNGPGIPEEVQARIWDPFWTTKEGSEGVGLGLSVVEHIVAEHGGSVHVESAPGQGARFVVRLPALRATARARSLRAAGGEQASRPLDVLVVDAEPRSLSFLTRFLTSRGHAVLAASDGTRALRLARQLTFDAVVCDASMGEEAGGVAAALRALPGCANARFVLSTETGEELARRLAAELPFPAAVAAKPYDVEALRRLIEEGDDA